MPKTVHLNQYSVERNDTQILRRKNPNDSFNGGQEDESSKTKQKERKRGEGGGGIEKTTETGTSKHGRIFREVTMKSPKPPCSCLDFN